MKALANASETNPTQLQLLSGRHKAMNEARVALDFIFDATEYVAHQGLPLRRREKKT